MWVVLAAAVFGVVGGPAPTARAASPSRQGWWKVGLPTADLGVGGVGNLRDPQTLDVPDGGLLVQGGSSVDQPAAYAAVAFDLGTAAVAGPLRLVPAASAVSIPTSTLLACPLDDASFKPADGAALADGPKFTCTSAVNATVDGSGAYLFDVAALRRGDTLAVAIIPSAPADRVVFARPNDDALPINESAGSADAATAPVPQDAPPTGDIATAPPLDTGGFPGLGEAPAVASVPDASAPASAPVAGLLPAARPATATRSSSTSYAPYVVIGLLLIAAVLWAGAGQQSQES